MLSGPSSSVTAHSNNAGDSTKEVFLAALIRPSFPFRHSPCTISTFGRLVWVQFHVSPPLISSQALQSQSLHPFLSIKTICLLISHHLSQICLKFCFSQNTCTSDFLQKYIPTTLAPLVLPLHNKAITCSPVPHAAKSGGGSRFWNPYSTWATYYTLNTKSTWACSDTWGRKAKPLLPSSQVPTSHPHPFPRFFLSSFLPQLGHGVKTILSHNVDPSPESTGYSPRLSQSDGVGKKRRKTWGN